MKYRKKPIVIEAEQWLGTKESWDRIMAFGDISWRPGEMGTESFFIATLEGDHRASKGDWIIRGVQGEYYPCRDDIFAATYEPAEETSELTQTRAALEGLKEAAEETIKLAGKNRDLFWKDEDGYLRNTYVEMLRTALDRAERVEKGEG